MRSEQAFILPTVQTGTLRPREGRYVPKAPQLHPHRQEHPLGRLWVRPSQEPQRPSPASLAL